MVNTILFKWEDSAALSHHCGVCNRPLHHPSARTSCFRTHSEPCHRYHQTVFMRLRGHTCHYCHTIDEAHFRRHKVIVRVLRDVYESCGESEWSIIPYDHEEHERLREYNSEIFKNTESEDSHPPYETPLSKRERKDAKCLMRAANRSKVISSGEVLLIEAIIHSADRFSTINNEAPRNSEEMEEIERHLKYNAHVYNTHGDRHDLKKFARLSDVDVDFDTELGRIFDVLRVTELRQRNTKTRGLQGKELKTFQTLLEDLKKLIVEDLVLQRRDDLEIRMRRAGYLRYINKTAHDILRDRYIDKDWKKGGKFRPSTSDLSGTSPIEEIDFSNRTLPDGPINSPPAGRNQGPDYRHLEKIHKRMNGDDGLVQDTIEPYNAPLLPVSTKSTSRMPDAVQVRVIANTGSYSVAAKDGSTQKLSVQANNETWQTVFHGKKLATPYVKPPWGLTASGRPISVPPRPTNPWGQDMCEIPDFRTFKAPAVQLPEVLSITVSEGPDHFMNKDNIVDTKDSVYHAIVTHKKAKKQEREARRKARKLGARETPIAAENNIGRTEDTTQMRNTVSSHAQDDQKPFKLRPNSIMAQAEVETAATLAIKTSRAEVAAANPSLSSNIPIQATQNNKHMQWVKFKHQFIADQLVEPPPLMSRCLHDHTGCIFEANNIPDCPFHEPACPSIDPLRKDCFLAYPCSSALLCGPFNRSRGKKLLAMFQQLEDFKGRIMLIDTEILDFLLLDSPDRTTICPSRLAQEYDDFENGHRAGPLMEQEREFGALAIKNIIARRQVSTELLTSIQYQQFEKMDKNYFCYCQADFPEEGKPEHIVECAHRDCTLRFFHKSCIKDLGFDKVSRWFCYECEEHIRALARRTLGLEEGDFSSSHKMAIRTVHKV